MKTWWLTVPGILIICYVIFIYLPSLWVVVQSGGTDYIGLAAASLGAAAGLVLIVSGLGGIRRRGVNHQPTPTRGLAYCPYPGRWLLYSGAVLTACLSAFILAQPASGRIVVLAQANLLVLLGFGLGIGAVWKLARFRNEEADAFALGPVGFQDTRLARFLYLGFMVLSMGFVIYYVSQLESIPLLDQVFRFRDVRVEAVARENSWKLLLSGPVAYLLSWLRALVFPVATLILFGAFLKTGSRFWLGTFILCLVLTLFFAALTTSRLPVMAVLVMLALFAVWMKVRWRWVLGLAGAAFAAMFVFDFLRNGHDITLTGPIIQNQMVRLFYSPASDLYSYFVAFPLESGFLWGRSVSFIPGYFDTAAHVARVQGATIASASCTAAFPGNAFADAGLAGVSLEAVAAGALAFGAQVLLVRIPRTALSLSLAAFFGVSMYILTQTSLTTTLGSGGLLLALAALAGLYIHTHGRPRGGSD
jgi:hypothetical protein